MKERFVEKSFCNISFLRMCFLQKVCSNEAQPLHECSVVEAPGNRLLPIHGYPISVLVPGSVYHIFNFISSQMMSVTAPDTG